MKNVPTPSVSEKPGFRGSSDHLDRFLRVHAPRLEVEAEGRPAREEGVEEVDREVAGDPTFGHRVLYELAFGTVRPPELHHRAQDREAEAEPRVDDDRELEARHEIERRPMLHGRADVRRRLEHLLDHGLGEELPPFVGVEEIGRGLLFGLGEWQDHRPRRAEVCGHELEVDLRVILVLSPQHRERQRLLVGQPSTLLDRRVEPVGQAGALGVARFGAAAAHAEPGVLERVVELVDEVQERNGGDRGDEEDGDRKRHDSEQDDREDLERAHAVRSERPDRDPEDGGPGEDR